MNEPKIDLTKEEAAKRIRTALEVTYLNGDRLSNEEMVQTIVEMLVLTDEEFLENLEPTGKPHMILKVKLNKNYFNNE